MDDRDMAVYEPPRAIKAVASKPKHNHTTSPFTHHNQLATKDRRKRDRESGAKVLNQLTNALARSNLSDKPTKSQLKNMRRAACEGEQAQTSDSVTYSKLEKKLIKQQPTAMRREARKEKQAEKLASFTNDKAKRKLAKLQRKKASRVARNEERARKLAVVIQNKSKEKRVQSGETRSMNEMLPLGFDSSYLILPDEVSSFMNNDQIRTWIMSVYTPHLKNWYHECLSVSANQYHLIAAQNDLHAFAKAVLTEALDQHHSSQLLGPLLRESDTCPSAFHLQMNQSNSLNFVQHSAMVVCLIVRDGQREGAFELMKTRVKLHRSAAMLLTTVIMDLKTDMGYFLRLFLGIDQGSALSWENSQALLAMKASKEGEQATNRKAKIVKVSKTIQIPSSLFRGIGEALLGLRRTSECKADLQEPSAPGIGCRVVLAGTAGEVGEAEQVIQDFLESSTAPADMDLKEISI